MLEKFGIDGGREIRDWVYSIFKFLREQFDAFEKNMSQLLACSYYTAFEGQLAQAE